MLAPGMKMIVRATLCAAFAIVVVAVVGSLERTMAGIGWSGLRLPPPRSTEEGEKEQQQQQTVTSQPGSFLPCLSFPLSPGVYTFQFLRYNMNQA